MADHPSKRARTGASSSNVSSKLTKIPDGMKKLNDSVWEYFKPPDGDPVPAVEVLFFHGAQLENDPDVFWKTWLSRNETVVWPTAWLAQKFPKARMLFISYDSFIQTSSGQRDPYQTVENLMSDIILSRGCEAGQKCPVILVGHCLGGVIIKAFLIKCTKYRNQKVSVFLQNCKSILFYSIPAAGSSLPEGVSRINNWRGNVNREILEFLDILSKHAARVNARFNQLLQDQSLQCTIRGIVEMLETKLGKSSSVLVVPEASARQELAMANMYFTDADHFDVARAKNDSNCVIFCWLRDQVMDHYNWSSSSTPLRAKFKSTLPFRNDEYYVPLQSTIDEVDDALEKSQLVVLHGDSGTGKSSLARHFALQFEKKHAPKTSRSSSESSRRSGEAVVVFLICGEGANIISIQQELLRKYGAKCPPRDESDRDDASFQRKLHDNLYEYLQDKDSLVILDDVWEKKLVEYVLVRGTKMKYFITTQNRDLWRHHSEVVQIKDVSMEQSRRILAKYAECKDEELSQGQADELIKEVGYHPLALASLGMVVQTFGGQSGPDWPKLKREFWKFWEADGDSYRPVLFDKSYSRSVRAAFMLAVERLDDDSKTVLHAINIFQGKRVSEYIVKLFLWLTQRDAFENFSPSIGVLERFSLVGRETVRPRYNGPYHEFLIPNWSSTETDHEDADVRFFFYSSVREMWYDGFVIHDLRRKLLSEDQHSNKRIIDFLSGYRKDFDRDTARTDSEYQLATILCKVFGQSHVREMTGTHVLPIEREDFWDFPPHEQKSQRLDMFQRMITGLAISIQEPSSNSVEAAIEVLSTVFFHGRVDLDKVSDLLWEPKFNRCAIEFIYNILDKLASPHHRDDVMLKFDGSWRNSIQLLSPDANSWEAKLQSVIVLSLLKIFSEKFLEPLGFQTVPTDLPDMLFKYLDKTNGRDAGSMRELSCTIICRLYASCSPDWDNIYNYIFFETTSPNNSHGHKAIMFVKLTSRKNLNKLVRLVGGNLPLDSTSVVAVLGYLIEFPVMPCIVKGLEKHPLRTLFETTSLLWDILKREIRSASFNMTDVKVPNTETTEDSSLSFFRKAEDFLSFFQITENREDDAEYDKGDDLEEDLEEDCQGVMEERLTVASVEHTKQEWRKNTEEDGKDHCDNEEHHCDDDGEDDCDDDGADNCDDDRDENREMDWEDWASWGRENPTLESTSKALLEFAALFLPREQLYNSIIEMSEFVQGDGDYALFIQVVASAPTLGLIIVDQDLGRRCLNKLVGLLDRTVDIKFQLAALQALHMLASCCSHACCPGAEIRVKMLETEHLLERVLMLCPVPSAVLLITRLFPIEDSDALQDSVFRSLSGKAEHFQTCLHGVAQLVNSKKTRTQAAGLKVLLVISRLAFNFVESGPGILIEVSAISNLVKTAVRHVVRDVKKILEANSIGQNGRLILRRLSLLVEFRFDQRLGVEGHLQMLTAPKVLKRLAVMISNHQDNDRSVYKTSTLMGIITVLSNLPSIRNLIAGFGDRNGTIIEILLVFLNAQRLPALGWFCCFDAFIALSALLDRDKLQSRIRNLHISPEFLSHLYSLWAWQYVTQEDFKAALKDLNQALKFGPSRRGPYSISLVLQERAMVRMHLGNFDGALKDFNRALKEGGDEYDCFRQRALVKFKLGDEEGARNDAARAMRIWPTRACDRHQEHENYDVALIYDDYPCSSARREPVKFLEYNLK